MIPAAALPRLGKLLRLLSSDNDGEALNAVRAVGSVLRTHGADFHDLADHIAATPAGQNRSRRGPPPREPPRRPPRSPDDAPTWEALDDDEHLAWLDRLLAFKGPTEWERSFLDDIRYCVLAGHTDFTAKQRFRLDRIIGRAFAAGVRV